MAEPTTMWVTRDGRKIPVADMEDSHLANAIGMLERKLGPTLMVYEMAARLEAQPPEDIHLSSTERNAKDKAWRMLLVLRHEQAKRERIARVWKEWEDEERTNQNVR